MESRPDRRAKSGEETLSFFVAAEPIWLKRRKAVVLSGPAGRHVGHSASDNRRLLYWANQIKKAAKTAAGKRGFSTAIDDPVYVTLAFYLPSNPRADSFPTGDPSLLNLAYTAIDALRTGLRMRPGQITDLTICKRYAAIDEIETGAHFMLSVP